MLKQNNIKHEVLNAKFHEQEAKIIGYAGMPGAVTIATNMAGRGTDIQLGEIYEIRKNLEISPNEFSYEQRLLDLQKDILNKKSLALKSGGLFYCGTERHESRRIDNQLREEPEGKEILENLNFYFLYKTI